MMALVSAVFGACESKFRYTIRSQKSLGVATHGLPEAEEGQSALLLAEQSHRVKNDMQRVMGLLTMQARGTSPEVAAALRVAANRVRVIARIQERLLVRDSCAALNACEFLESLVSDVQTSLEGLQPVVLLVEAEAHTLSGAQASAIGLVTNELITNALKHAFPNGRKGTLRIGFRRDGSEYMLIVADDGVGWSQRDQDAAPAGAQSGGLGQRLTAALAMQLHGRIEVSSGDPSGTVVTMRFPLDFHADAAGVPEPEYEAAGVQHTT